MDRDLLNEALSGSNQTLSIASEAVFYSHTTPFIDQAGDNRVGFTQIDVMLQTKYSNSFVVNGSDFVSFDIRKREV